MSSSYYRHKFWIHFLGSHHSACAHCPMHVSPFPLVKRMCVHSSLTRSGLRFESFVFVSLSMYHNSISGQNFTIAGITQISEYSQIRRLGKVKVTRSMIYVESVTKHWFIRFLKIFIIFFSKFKQDGLKIKFS